MRGAANIEGKSSPAKVFLHDVGGGELVKEFSRSWVIYMKSHDVALLRIEKPAGKVSP